MKYKIRLLFNRMYNGNVFAIVRRNKLDVIFWVLLIVIIIFGYATGKNSSDVRVANNISGELSHTFKNIIGLSYPFLAIGEWLIYSWPC